MNVKPHWPEIEAVKVIHDFDLLSIIKSKVKGALPITITICTEPELVGGKKPFQSLQVISTLNVMINARYQNMVNNVAKREGNPNAGKFLSEPMKGREWISGLEGIGSFSVKDGTENLECNLAKNGSKILGYIIDGKRVSAEEGEWVKAFIYKRPRYEKQHRFGNVKPVARRSIKVSNIDKVRMKGEDYEVEHI